MRTKAQILNDSRKLKQPTPEWDTTASLHEELTIEVLIDIRDQLTTMITMLGSVLRIAGR